MKPELLPTLAPFRSYTKSVQWQKLYRLDGIDYLCDCDATLVLWENNERYPSLQYLWPIEAWDAGGHMVINKDTLAKLHKIVTEALADDHYEELIEQIRRQGV